MPENLQQMPSQWNKVYSDANLKIDVFVPSADQFQQNNSPDALQCQVRVSALGSPISLRSFTLAGSLRNNPLQNSAYGFSLTLDQNQTNYVPTSSTKQFNANQSIASSNPWTSNVFPVWIKRNWDGATARLGFYIRDLDYSVSCDDSDMSDPNQDSYTTLLF